MRASAASIWVGRRRRWLRPTSGPVASAVVCVFAACLLGACALDWGDDLEQVEHAPATGLLDTDAGPRRAADGAGARSGDAASRADLANGGLDVGNASASDDSGGATGGPPPPSTEQVALGKPCTSPDACASGMCADGVCCDAPCAGSCWSCVAPGKIGTCTTVQAGTVCGAARCSTALTTHIAEATCDGLGACLPGPSKSCGAYLCDGSVPWCRASCGDQGHCQPNAHCKGGKCKWHK